MCFFYSLPKQILMLDKIFMAVSNTTFAHMGHNKQHKMKIYSRVFKV